MAATATGHDARPAPGQSRATVTGNNTQITLAWSPVAGACPAASLITTSIATERCTPRRPRPVTSDTSGISSQTRYSYQVTAVNYDGVEGVKSAAVTAVPAGIAAIMTPSTTSVLVQFTEPVDPTTAHRSLANYTITGGVTITARRACNRTATPSLLTTSALGTSSYTLTVSNVKTLALSALPRP